MILLDTHVLLWHVAGSPRLGARARREIERAWQEGEASASAFTFWEIAMLHTDGRIDLDLPPRALLKRLKGDGLRIAGIDDETAIRSAELGAEGFHKDPADRIIVATAIVGGHRLATADRGIIDWNLRSRLVGLLDAAA